MARIRQQHDGEIVVQTAPNVIDGALLVKLGEISYKFHLGNIAFCILKEVENDESSSDQKIGMIHRLCDHENNVFFELLVHVQRGAKRSLPFSRALGRQSIFSPPSVCTYVRVFANGFAYNYYSLSFVPNAQLSDKGTFYLQLKNEYHCCCCCSYGDKAVFVKVSIEISVSRL